MKYNFWGYDTKTILDLGLDANDLAFIQWFRDYRDSGNMESIDTPNGKGYYVAYSKVVEDIPFLFKSSVGVTDEEQLKKIEATNKKKVFNMLRGELSKVFYRAEKKEQGKTKIYLVMRSEVFTALINNGRDFDGTEISGETKVVKLNRDAKATKVKKDKKKAPSTAPTVKDANTNTDIKFNTDNIPQSDDNVNTNTAENDINYDELSINGISLLDNEIKVADIKVADKIVANWDGVIMAEAISITLANSKSKAFNYLKKTYESLIADGESIEAVRDKLLEPVFIPKYSLNR
ncbi:TPA: hypothetical protein KOX39_003392 [Clostridioides difficile]|nr:hypothetical protein [Clostridioides difficile]